MTTRLYHACCIASLLYFSTAVSQTTEATTIGGYGELHYNEPDGSKRGVLDFHRFVVYLGHAFDEHLVFRSEIEIEHTKLEAGEPDGGEVALEQAYLDYTISRTVGIRAGIVLVPVGLINLYHEPPTFNGVERPAVDQVIIPTTWRESGAGIFGSPADNFSYQAYVVAGLKAEGFSGASGLRGGRQEGFESNPANPSFTGRLDYTPLPGLRLGASFFAGNSAADEDSIGSATVTLWSADARYSIGNFSCTAVGAMVKIGNTENINARFGGNVASSLYGFYVEGAYNVLPPLFEESDQQLLLFARYEKYNTQATTVKFPGLEEYNRNSIVLGVTYKPTYNTAFKFDYTFLNNALNSGLAQNTKQLNMGIGYFFN